MQQNCVTFFLEFILELDNLATYDLTPKGSKFKILIGRKHRMMKTLYKSNMGEVVTLGLVWMEVDKLYP